MFTCERCGSNFSPVRLARTDYCPRCRAREGIRIPLTFDRPPDRGTKEDDSAEDRERPGPPSGLEPA
jgi:hypothetical protein